MSTAGIQQGSEPLTGQKGLPDFAGIPEGMDRGKAQIDLFKYRADEFRDRYESMRTLEWNIIFQTYAGYAAIAVAFKYIRSESPDQKLVSVLAMLGTTILYLASRYLAFRIQERLLRFDQIRDNYMDQLHSALHIPPPAPDVKSLGHPYYWTYDSQLVLSTVTFVGLLAYEARAVLVSAVEAGVLAFGLIAMVLIIAGLWFVPVERPRKVKRVQKNGN